MSYIQNPRVTLTWVCTFCKKEERFVEDAESQNSKILPKGWLCLKASHVITFEVSCGPHVVCSERCAQAEASALYLEFASGIGTARR